MSVGLRELRTHELNAELERVLMPRLGYPLKAGHLMPSTT